MAKGIWAYRGMYHAVEIRISEELENEIAIIVQNLDMGFTKLDFSPPSVRGRFPFLIEERTITVEFRITRRVGEGVKSAKTPPKNIWDI